MSFLKIETLRSRSLRTDSTLLLEGVLVGLLAGGAGVIYRLLISWCEDSVSYLASAPLHWARSFVTNRMRAAAVSRR